MRPIVAARMGGIDRRFESPGAIRRENAGIHPTWESSNCIAPTSAGFTRWWSKRTFRACRLTSCSP